MSKKKKKKKPKKEEGKLYQVNSFPEDPDSTFESDLSPLYKSGHDYEKDKKKAGK